MDGVFLALLVVVFGVIAFAVRAVVPVDSFLLSLRLLLSIKFLLSLLFVITSPLPTFLTDLQHEK